MGKFQIIPAILAVTEKEYVEKLKKIEKSGLFENKWIQIDFMDSKFVQNKSINPSVLAKYPTKLKIETHLMVEYPESWIDELIKVRVRRIIFPVEDTAGTDERIEHIKNHGIEVGLSLNPETPVANIEPFIGKIDLALIMSVHPGFSSQQFIPESIDKVKECSHMRSNNNASFKIEVDGGIDEKAAKDLTEAGADYLVMGSHLWETIHD